MRSVQRGMTEQAGDDKVAILTANSDNKVEKEANLIDTYIARGVKAIVIAPLGEEASIPALKRADAKGIKIVTWTTDIKADFPVSTVGSSGHNMGAGTGQAAARFIKEKLGGKANVALIGFKSQLASLSDARTAGFVDEAKKGGELNVQAEQDAWLAEKAATVVTDILTAHPDINVVYAANEGGTVGAVQAVRRAGKQGKVFVFGTDGSEQITKFLQDDDGVMVATTAAQPKLIGREAVKAALAAVDGKPVEKHVEVPVVPLSRDDSAALTKYAAEIKVIN
ncbi:MAG: substrate-binding domain-containing protein [Alphaproteobacteria bacterium]